MSVTMLKNNDMHDLLYRVTCNSIQRMQIKAEHFLNPHRHHLSPEAKKRLRWLYLLYYECSNNVTRAANKIGISRQWLSTIKSTFENSGKDPRRLEPESRAPHHTTKRNKISQETEAAIIAIRDRYGWGKEKIAVVLDRDFGLKAHASTVNRHLHDHLRIDPKISQKNKQAWQDKKEREQQKEVITKIKYRPPTKIKDYMPGALGEKDMKLIPKPGSLATVTNGKYRIKDLFRYQHTVNDSFTRVRALELVRVADSDEATEAYKRAEKRLPFDIACMNTDNGGENGKHFEAYLQNTDTIHFHSRTGTPTDNPRVERSHLTDEKEFYGRGNLHKSFEEQEQALREWEDTYNCVRPHQALGYLTPMEFY
ncbi:integrase core domain-containing protein, partial [Patescibacteria group bacterium AH-259-L07]|nr:integrase core domain-containing protein [Patescibacteria group bacterium AH-259-L07]